MTIHRILAPTLLSLAWGVAGAQARATQPVTLDIAAQPMRAALQQFGEQAGLQVLMRLSGDETDNVRLCAVNGEFTAAEGLERLLAKTGLQYEFVNERTVRVAKAEPTAEGNDASNSEDSDENEVAEVVVTAQKRAERLQDVPISITVLNGNQLDQSVVESSTEMLNRVPGVNLRFGSTGSSTVSIRGVQAGVGQTTSTAAFYIDSVPYGPSRDGRVMNVDVYDLDRIEVLRGPQGTLHGANALNGVIRILSRDPQLDKFELKTRVMASSTDAGGQNYRGGIAVNVPLVPGRLALRAVGDYQDLSGWIDKTPLPGRPLQTPGRKDANDAEITNFRLKLAAQPIAALSVVASAWLARNDYGAQSIGRDDLTNNSSDLEPFTIDYDVYGLKVGYDFSGFSLTSSTGYIDYRNDSALTFEPNGFIGGVRINTLQFTKMDRSAFSEEVVFNSTRGGSWRWTLGGMYRDSNDRLRVSFDPTRLIQPVNLPQDQEDHSESVAAFGELTRSFWDGKLELTAGVRYFHDDYEYEENVSYTGNPATPLVQTSAVFEATTPRVTLTWLPNEHLTMYTSYSEGFRSGLTQTPRALAAAAAVGVRDLPPLDPDSLKNYEIGSKGSLGRVGFDIAVYYIDWQDTQRALSIPLFGNDAAPFVTALVNASSASGAGVDVELTVRPMRRLLFGVNYSHSDLRLDADLVSGGVVSTPKGAPLGTPRTTYGAFADLAFPLGALTGRLAGSMDYISQGCERGFTAARVPFYRCGTEIKGSRASLSLEADARWSATLFAENLLNRNDRYSNNAASGLPDWDTRLRPRTIGLQLQYSY